MDPLQSLRDLRCRAPSSQSPDGRCPNQLLPNRRDSALYCSGACRARASRARHRANRDPVLRVLSGLQQGRPLRLVEHPALLAQAQLRAAQRLVDLAPSLPSRTAPRTFEGTVPSMSHLESSVSDIPKEGRYVGVAVVPLKGEVLVVTVIA